jgi:predicted ABC-type ATPase
MTTSKQLWLLAGGNGAGKSTFYDNNLAATGMIFLNADLIAKDIDGDNTEDINYAAAAIAAELRDDLLAQGATFCYETVFSHESKIDFISKAIDKGYEVILVYIHLENPELNEARVIQRTTEGGHAVPIDKIHSRIPRTIKNISKVLPLVSEARILNNSYRLDPFKTVAIVEKGQLIFKLDPLSDWAKDILSLIPIEEDG